MLSSAQDPISLIVMILVAIVTILVALFFILAWADLQRQAKATRSWPMTTGRVLVSRVTSFYSRNHTIGGTSRYYDPLVSYEYTVNGTTFKSKRVSIGIGISLHDRAAVKKRIEAYPVGTTVQVFYDPNDPQAAVLEHGVTGGLFLWFVSIFIVVVVFVVLFVPVDRILKLVGL